MDANSLTSRIGNPLPTAMPLELRERVGFTPAHARWPDPRALGSVDNDDELCPKPAYSKLHGYKETGFESFRNGDPGVSNDAKTR